MSASSGAERTLELHPLLRRFTTALVLVGAFFVIDVLVQASGDPSPSARATVVVGFLLLVAMVAGKTAQSVGLPRITGYLVVGCIVGPEVLSLVTTSDLARLELINRLAVGVIALIAGGELRMSMIKARARPIFFILGLEIALVFAAVWTALMLARPYVPFLADASLGAAAVLATVFASIATVNSPAVTIAVLNELRPRGPLTSTTLGIVVAADIVVVLAVTVALSFARVIVEGQAFEPQTILLIGWELIGAILLGALVGALTDLYLRAGGAQLVLFALFLPLVGGQLATSLHVEFMLFMVSVGFFIENVSPMDGEPLLRALTTVSVPAYALFFALAGASIHLQELRMLWPIALMVVGVRGAALWVGCWGGARLADAEPEVRRYTWMGLVSQAGVALGLVMVAARVLPEAGPEMLTLFLAMIAIHEAIGPVLFKTALVRSGEAAQATGDAAAPTTSSARS